MVAGIVKEILAMGGDGGWGLDLGTGAGTEALAGEGGLW